MATWLRPRVLATNDKAGTIASCDYRHCSRVDPGSIGLIGAQRRRAKPASSQASSGWIEGRSDAQFACANGLALRRSRCDENLHFNPSKRIGHADETAGYRGSLTDIANNGDRYQIEAAQASIGWIEGDPACAWNEDLRPGMSRSRASRSHALLIGIIEIA